jgi:predicted ATPase with chaperone activity
MTNMKPRRTRPEIVTHERSRVARTMADLEGVEAIQPHHVAEAVGFRALDRSVWA